MVNVDYLNKHSKWTYGWKGNKNPEDRGKLPNKDYDPKAKPDKKPDYCTGHVCIKCLRSGIMCPHLAFSGVEKKLKTKFVKIVKEMYEED